MALALLPACADDSNKVIDAGTVTLPNHPVAKTNTSTGLQTRERSSAAANTSIPPTTSSVSPSSTSAANKTSAPATTSSSSSSSPTSSISPTTSQADSTTGASTDPSSSQETGTGTSSDAQNSSDETNSTSDASTTSDNSSNSLEDTDSTSDAPSTSNSTSDSSSSTSPSDNTDSSADQNPTDTEDPTPLEGKAICDSFAQVIPQTLTAATSAEAARNLAPLALDPETGTRIKLPATGPAYILLDIALADSIVQLTMSRGAQYRLLPVSESGQGDFFPEFSATPLDLTQPLPACPETPLRTTHRMFHLNKPVVIELSAKSPRALWFMASPSPLSREELGELHAESP